MFNKEQIIEELNKFCEKYGVEKIEIDVFSGAALVLRGLRAYASDVDVCVPRETCMRLIATNDFVMGISRRGPQHLRFENGVLDIGDSGYECDLVIDGYNVQSLDSLLAMKLWMNREKDQLDIRNIQAAMIAADR